MGKVQEQIELREHFLPFVPHLLIGALGTFLVTGVLSATLSLFVSPNLVSIVALGPLFLVPLVSRIALEYAFGQIFPSRAAMWVWVVTAVLLVIPQSEPLQS